MQKVFAVDFPNYMSSRFEPAPPKGTELESVALDHSAIDTVLFVKYG